MRPRTRFNEHAATPMPTAAAEAADGRRVLRSHRKGAGRSNNNSRSSNVATTANPTEALLLTQSENRVAPNTKVGTADASDVAPMFREHAERGLAQIRLVVDDRKDKLTKKMSDLHRQLDGQLLFAKRSLPEAVRKMKIKDYDALYGCDLLEMLKGKALGIFLGMDDDDEGVAEACPATIRRSAGRGDGQRGRLRHESSQDASSSAGAGFETPAVARAKPSNAAFWSTTAKKTRTAQKKSGEDSPDEKILTVSKKKGAILESCGMDLLTLAHDPEKAGPLDVASLENIQKLHQLSTMILQHQQKYHQQGIGLLGAVAEEDDE